MRTTLNGDISYIDFGLAPFDEGGGDMMDVRFNSWRNVYFV